MWPVAILALMLTGLVVGENAKIQCRFPIYDEFVASFAYTWTSFKIYMKSDDDDHEKMLLGKDEGDSYQSLLT